jgi:hypothetical protein
MPNPQQDITQIPSNRVEIIDSKTGMVSREWYRFFLNLFNLAGAGGNQTSLDDLQIGPPPQPTTSGAGTVTSVNVSGGTTGLSTSGGPVTTSGTITLAGTLNVANGGTGVTTSTGSGSVVLNTSPTLVTPILGVATASSLNIGTLTYTPANALISSQSSATTYNQVILQNSNTGSTASADFIVNNSNSTDTTYYGDFGMNSSGFAGSGAFNQPNTVYLTSTTADLAIGTTTSNGIHFVINGGTTDAMSINTSGAIGVNGAFGTAGQVLTSAGVSAVPTWTTPTSGGVTSVTGTSPVVSSGGTTPAISLAASYGDTQNPYASKTANYFLAAPNGSAGAPTFRAVVAADIPTLNQNTTGTASNVTGIVAIANGGTGQTTQQAALTALSGTQTSGQYLRSNGTNTLLSAIQAADVPTLNQNTTGTASNITASSNSTLTTLSALSLPGSQVSGNISGNAANVTGTVAVANGGTGLTSTPANGALDIGNGTGFTRSTLTAGSGISVTNAAGAITIANTSPSSGGTVTSVAALTLGTTGTDLSSSVANSTTTPVITLNVPTASATNRGALSSADWTTFNNKGSGTVTSVTGTSPVVSSGGTTPAISLATAYGDTLNPYASKTANYFLAAPNGTTGAPTFRAVVAADIPTLNQNTTGTASNITASSNSTLTTLSALSLPGSQVSGNISGNSANVTGTVAIANGGTGQTTQQAALTALSGTQTSGQYLRSNGTNTLLSAIQAADVPTLNQNTTGTASNVTGVVAIANGGTGQTTANTAFNALAPSQTANTGKYLTTDGTNTSWATVASSSNTTAFAFAWFIR